MAWLHTHVSAAMPRLLAIGSALWQLPNGSEGSEHATGPTRNYTAPNYTLLISLVDRLSKRLPACSGTAPFKLLYSALHPQLKRLLYKMPELLTTAVPVDTSFP